MKEPLTPANRLAQHPPWLPGFPAPSRQGLPPHTPTTGRRALLWTNLGLLALFTAGLLAGRSLFLLGGAAGLEPASRSSSHYLAADLLGLALILAALGAPLLLAACKARHGGIKEALQPLWPPEKCPLPPHANSAHRVAPSLPHNHAPPRQPFPNRRAY